MTKTLCKIGFCVAACMGLVDANAAKPPNKKIQPTIIHPPLEIKGIRLGVTMEELTAQVPYTGCRRGHCETYTTIAGAPAEFFEELVDGKVDDVYLSKWKGSDVSDVVRGFEAKYGPPQISTRVLQNGFGARWECPLYTWNLPDGTLWVAAYRPDTRDLPQIEMKSIERSKRDPRSQKKTEGDV